MYLFTSCCIQMFRVTPTNFFPVKRRSLMPLNVFFLQPHSCLCCAKSICDSILYRHSSLRLFKYSNSNVRAPSGGNVEIECGEHVRWNYIKKINKETFTNLILNSVSWLQEEVGIVLDLLLKALFRNLTATFSPPRSAQTQIVYISGRVLVPLCGLLHCSLRCVTYGKQWISQYTVCSLNVFWLTFQWSRLSLWLPAKIVAVRFGCSPAWIYGGVSLSEDRWLVWVAVENRWLFCPMISALHFVNLLILYPRFLSVRGGGGERVEDRLPQSASSETSVPAVCYV